MLKEKLIGIFLWIFVVSIVSFLFYENQFASAETQIPSWIKNRIGSWADSQASDSDFVASLAELSKHGLIKFYGDVENQNTYQLPKYGETFFVRIAGRTGDYEQTSPVTLIVIAPNGEKSEYTIPVLESSAYSTVIPITHNSQPGTYTVIAYHVGKELSTSYFFVGDKTPIPFWIKGVAKWWAEEKISDRDFVLSMQYLIDKDVIKIGTSSTATPKSTLDVSVNGLKAVRRNTAQTLEIQVDNMAGPVNGATVFVRVEDYGENILKEFQGITDSTGSYNVSWELRDFNDIETLLVFVDVTDGISSDTSLFKFQVYCLCGEPNCKCRN